MGGLYQILLNMKALDASKELQRHFRHGLKFENFGCATHCNITFSFMFDDKKEAAHPE